MLVESQKFIELDSIEKEPVAPGVTRQVMGHNEQIMAVRVTFEKGSEGYVHSHFHSQISYIESGKFEVMIDGEKQTLKAGDCFYVAPNAEHGAVCLEPGVLIDIFSPVRADFLAGQ
ncbi:cupin domain-containing protein [Granulosicoccaceae sp. 1_MG-2023]|nr:cupin domain-containing protein [Granulosicoccaceae sp. 1_MG-2023]